MGPGGSDKPLKDALRSQALGRRDALCEASRQEAALAIAGHLAVLAKDLPQGPVAAYWPIRSEADPRAGADDLRQRGHEIALPAVTPHGLVFRRWEVNDPLARAGFGLWEPLPESPQIVPRTLLVPLAAFDRRGHRIGYGKGHYDRALAALGRVLTIGIAFSVQEINLIPDEPHDHPLDFVVTEREILNTAQQRDL